MNYDNLPCPVCGKPMAEGDDIVVCPVCATPQHRECWIERGRCANDDLHSSGYVWKKENKTEVKTEEAAANPDNRICHICGSENPADSLHCGNCGALFGAEAKPDDNSPKKCAYCGKDNDSDALHCKYCGAPVGGQQFYKNNPFLSGSGIAEDELIAGQKATDVAFFVQASSKKYLPKFKKFANGKKISFNFAAFFFAPYWFFYRKLYKAGIFAIVILATASMVLSGFTNQMNAAANEYLNVYENIEITEETTDEEYKAAEAELLKAAETMKAKATKPMLIVGGVQLVLHLLFALTADRLYYKKVFADLKEIHNAVEDDNFKKMMITRRGGLSPLAFAASIMGNNMLLMALDYVAALINGM